MKIAIISTRPLSKNSGADSRNYHLAKILSKKFSVNSYTPLFTNKLLMNKNEEVHTFKKVFLLLQGKIPYIEHLKLAIFSESTIKQLQSTDFIQLEEMSSYYVIEKYLKDLNVKIVLDTHNIDYQRFLSEIESKGFVYKYIGKIIAKKLKREEIKAIKKVNHILVCSEAEKRYFSNYVNKNKITVIPNGVDYKNFTKVKKTTKDIILFMGLLSYAPNLEGIKYYIKNIHPQIVKKFPNIQLLLLGKGANRWLIETSKKDKNINLLGFVDDVRKYIAQAKVCICPVFSGSGTRLKILEYMAIGKPVVSTIKGAEGLEINNNNNILLANSKAKFITQISKLLSDNNLHQDISFKGQLLIEEKYDWNKINKKIYLMYAKLN